MHRKKICQKVAAKKEAKEAKKKDESVLELTELVEAAPLPGSIPEQSEFSLAHSLASTTSTPSLEASSAVSGGTTAVAKAKTTATITAAAGTAAENLTTLTPKATPSTSSSSYAVSLEDNLTITTPTASSSKGFSPFSHQIWSKKIYEYKEKVRGILSEADWATFQAISKKQFDLSRTKAMIEDLFSGYPGNDLYEEYALLMIFTYMDMGIEGKVADDAYRQMIRQNVMAYIEKKNLQEKLDELRKSIEEESAAILSVHLDATTTTSGRTASFEEVDKEPLPSSSTSLTSGLNASSSSKDSEGVIVISPANDITNITKVQEQTPNVSKSYL